MNKKLLYALGALCIVVAALFVGKTWHENKIRNRIEAALAALPAPLTGKAERIDVSSLGKAVTLTNLHFEYTGADGKITYTIASATASGIALDAFKSGAGTAKLADSLVLRDVVATAPSVTARIATYTLKDIHGDYSLMLNALVAALPDFVRIYADPDSIADAKEAAPIFGHLGSLIQAFETMSVGNIAIENYGYTIAVVPDEKEIDGLVERISIEGYSLKKMGPTAMRNFTMNAEGAPFLRIDAVTLDEVILPSLAKLFDILAKQPRPGSDLDAMREALGGQPFSLKNLRVTGLGVLSREQNGMEIFTLDTASFGYDAGDVHVMEFDYNGMTFTRELLKQVYMPETALERLGNGITFEGGSSVRLTPREQGMFDVAYRKKAQSASLGESAISIDLENFSLKGLEKGLGGPLALKGFDLTLTDGGASDIVFIVIAEHSGKSPEEARAGCVAKLLEQRGESPNDTLADLVGTLADFIKEPGKTFRMTLAPAQAIRFAELQTAIFVTPEQLGLSASVTAAP